MRHGHSHVLNRSRKGIVEAILQLLILHVWLRLRLRIGLGIYHRLGLGLGIRYRLGIHLGLRSCRCKVCEIF